MRLLKLNLGSGYCVKDGFENLDAVHGHMLPGYLSRYPNGCADLIFSEHFIEHLTWEDGLALAKECRRIIRPGTGRIQFACPDLRIVAERYLAGTLGIWGGEGAWNPKTPAVMINQSFRAWGHLYLYDEPEMRRLFEEAGFSHIERRERFPECLRADFGDLYVEAWVA